MSTDEREALHGADAAWLRMDHPGNHMVITVLLRFAEPVPAPVLADALRTGLLPFRRFRQRVVDRGHATRHPAWALDPDFDLEAHLHHVALPAPANDTALAELVGDLMAAPLDPALPLWSVHLVDRPDGRSDVIFRVHHSIADGFALLYLTLALADEPERIRLPVGHVPEPPPGADHPPQRHRLADAFALSRRVVRSGLDAAVHPERLLAALETGGAVASSAAHLVALKREPDTPLRGTPGVVKHVAWSDALPLAPLKERARGSEATLNDLLMAAMTGAVRRYLLSRGHGAADDIRAVVPVNLKSLEERDEPLGNDFGLVFVDLPVSIADRDLRFDALRARMEALKQSPEAAVAFAALAAAGSAPPAVQDRLLDLFRAKASLIVTNVPGPTERIAFAGREVEDLLFWVPQSLDIGLGLSIISYDGHVRVGVASDAHMIPDPAELVRFFEDEIRLLGH